MLKFYSRFEISDETGDPLTDHDMTQLHYSKITSLQVSKTPEDVSVMVILQHVQKHVLNSVPLIL